MNKYRIVDMELSLPDTIHCNKSDDYEAVVLCFDGIAYTHYRGVYLKLVYPTVKEASESDDMRIRIGKYRFGDAAFFDGDESVDIEDCAITFGEVHRITKQQYFQIINQYRPSFNHDTKVCDECGELIHEGYSVEHGRECYCSEKCLNKHYTPDEWCRMSCQEGAEDDCCSSDYDWDNDCGNDENGFVEFKNILYEKAV